jgi:hypothetical protein
MSAVAGPYGLRVVKLLGDLPFSGGVHSYPLTANQAKGFYFGDPVGLTGGNPVPLTATPTTTLSANNPIGVFMGAEWIDPVRGFVNAQYLPANAISNGATKVKLKIADSPTLVMQVQADGPVTADKIGLNAALTGFSGGTGGNVATGDSTVALVASSAAATATLAVRIYDFVNTGGPAVGAGSQPGDAFTDVLVVWNFGVHRMTMSAAQ